MTRAAGRAMLAVVALSLVIGGAGCLVLWRSATSLERRAHQTVELLRRLDGAAVAVVAAAAPATEDSSRGASSRLSAARVSLKGTLDAPGMPARAGLLIVRADAVLQQSERRLAPDLPDDAGGSRDSGGCGDVACDLRRAAELVNGARGEVVAELEAATVALERQALVTGILVCAGLLVGSLGWVTRWHHCQRAGARTEGDESARLLAAAVRSTDEGVLISDTGTREGGPTIVFVNRSFREMLGLSEAELVGRPLKVLRDSCLREQEFSVLEHGRGDSKSATIETVQWRGDGSKLHCAWHISPVRDEAGSVTHFISVLRDVTQLRSQEEEQRKTHAELLAAYRKLRENQEQLVQSEKMAFLGQLAAGVAHEINNPVGYVMSNLGTLADMMGDVRELVEGMGGIRRCLDQEDVNAAGHALAGVQLADATAAAEFLDDLDEILKDSRAGLVQVREIVERLKNFARPDEGTMEEADVNAQVEGALKIVWNELKHRCAVEKNLAALPLLLCRPGRLSQVFTNLLVNAAQAIPNTGTITITTTYEAPDIVVRIADDGKGIAPEHLSKVFAPFFTTKATGQGTGLGLAVSYGIVQNHGGTIEVRSQVGKGSEFTVRLPVRTGSTANGLDDQSRMTHPG